MAAGGEEGGGGAAMAGDAEVTGVARYCATERRFANQKLREREKAKASSPRAKTRPGKGPSGSLHGRRPWSSLASMAGALESPILLGKWTGRERERRGSSPARREAAKMAQSEGRRAADHGEVR